LRVGEHALTVDVPREHPALHVCAVEHGLRRAQPREVRVRVRQVGRGKRMEAAQGRTSGAGARNVRLELRSAIAEILDCAAQILNANS
jgi:hypothetical protein